MSDIEDNAMDVDEVNACFRRGILQEGTMFLERVEKQAMDDRVINNERDLIRVFDKLSHKVDRGNDIEVLKEFEKFGLGSDVILKMGKILISAHNTTPRSPKKKSLKKNASERYYDDEDFEDYDDEDFEDFEPYEDGKEDEKDDGPYKTESSINVSKYPKYTEEEPYVQKRSHTAPATVAASSAQFASRDSPKVGASMYTSKFKTLSWLKKGQWRAGEKIGSGSFGEVFQGMTDGGMLFAVKCLNFSQNMKEIAALIKEIELMQTLCHPNIVQYLGANVSIMCARGLFIHRYYG